MRNCSARVANTSGRRCMRKIDRISHFCTHRRYRKFELVECVFRIDSEWNKLLACPKNVNFEIYKCVHHHLWSLALVRSLAQCSIQHARTQCCRPTCECIRRRSIRTNLYETVAHCFCSCAVRTCTILWISLITKEKSNTFEIRSSCSSSSSARLLPVHFVYFCVHMHCPCSVYVCVVCAANGYWLRFHTNSIVGARGIHCSLLKRVPASHVNSYIYTYSRILYRACV